MIFSVRRPQYFIPWEACGTPTVKIRFGCTPKKSLSIISSSKPTNQVVQNLYRFLIDLLPLKNVPAKFVAPL